MTDKAEQEPINPWDEKTIERLPPNVQAVIRMLKQWNEDEDTEDGDCSWEEFQAALEESRAMSRGRLL